MSRTICQHGYLDECIDGCRSAVVDKNAQLTEARAEIERLKEQRDSHQRMAIRALLDFDALEKTNATLRTERAELEADVVWAVENGAREVRNEHRGKPGCRVIALAFDESNSTVDCDGTSADILRAVREARNGVS